MRHRKWLAVALAAVLTLGLGAGASEAASVFAFSGHGTASGAAEPVPLQWQVHIFEGVGFWGIPGIGDGTVLWPSETSVTDFHISFTGRSVVRLGDDTNFFDTRFLSQDGFDMVPWTVVVNNTQDGGSVDFFAPQGVTLEQGEAFFVNVRWGEEASAVRDFEAHWTTDAIVPEPASLSLLGAGLVALLAARRRRA